MPSYEEIRRPESAVPELDALALTWRTDKSSAGHFYTRWYEAHWGELRERPQSLLEIGVGDGRSLGMWQNWAPTWRVSGIDVYPQCEIPDWCHGNQADVSFLLRVADRLGKLDLVVDDGGHEAHGQITAFETLFARLTPGGWYAVEDLHTSFPSREGIGGLQYFLRLVEELHGAGRFDLGEPRNLPYFAGIRQTLSYFTRWVAAIHFYPNLVMIRKRNEEL